MVLSLIVSCRTAASRLWPAVSVPLQVGLRGRSPRWPCAPRRRTPSRCSCCSVGLKRAAGHFADDVAADHDCSGVPCRAMRLAGQFEPDELPLRARSRRSARKGTRADEVLGQIHRPAQPGGERVDSLGQLVAVQRHGRLPGGACRARPARRGGWWHRLYRCLPPSIFIAMLAMRAGMITSTPSSPV
jgi:hypothetical protein